MADGLSENDPYRKMETGSDAIRPEWDYVLNGIPYKNGERYSDKKGGSAGGLLKQAEGQAAGNSISDGKIGTKGLGVKESNPGSLFSGKGKSSKSKGKGKGKGGSKGKGFLKKAGPVGLIIGLIMAVGGLMGGLQSLQPFSLLSQFRETFNSMHTSASSRSNAFLRYQMRHELVKDPIKSRIFREDTFKITKKQASKLAGYGIKYDDDFDGNGTRVLKYDNGSGEIKIIAADEVAATRLTNMDLSRFDTGDIKYNTEAVSFKNFYSSDAEFSRSYNNGSMTWRGAIANWFGTTTVNFLKNNKLTRNLFKNFDQDVKDSGEDTRVVATDLIAKNAGDTIEEGGVRVATAGEDDDGNVKYDDNGIAVRSSDDVVDSGGGSTSRSRFKGISDVKSKLKKMADDFSGGSLTGTAQKVANYACLGLNFLGGVSLLVTASEALQIINLTTSYFEAIDKVKAGDGDDSPMNTLMDAMNEHKTNTNVELATKTNATISSDMESNVTENGVSALETKTVTTNKSAMDSDGIMSLYSGKRVNSNDPSVQSFNFTSSIKKILGGLGTSMTTFRACSFTKVVANAAGALQTGLEIAGCIAGLVGAAFTFGMSSSACSALIADAAIGAAVSVGASILISGIISTITPVIAKMLMRDLITNLGGEDLGNALTSGGNMYLGNTHRSNGGSLASYEKYKEYAAVHQQVIAEDARQERMTRDPFDATSKYTFLGTLLTQMMSFRSINSLASAVMSTRSAVSSSIIAMSPTASAYDITDTLIPMDEYEDICPYLASVGAVGDVFCNPYSITDVSTIQLDPSEVTNILNDNFLDGTSSDGNVQIKGNSDLAKYILFCDNRNSAFGIADQNIVNQVSDWGQVQTDSSVFNNVVNSAFGTVPVIGDIIDVVDNSEALANAGYVSGESCVAGNNVGDAQAPNWDKAKYYQRFIEDQSLMEGMGLIEQSAVTAFLDEYYKENPLDNSYEGILARYSGLKKDDVVALLDIIDYANYIADYNPSERYIFGEPAIEEKEELIFDDGNNVAKGVWVVLMNQISYADVRNRSFAV